MGAATLTAMNAAIDRWVKQAQRARQRDAAVDLTPWWVNAIRECITIVLPDSTLNPTADPAQLKTLAGGRSWAFERFCSLVERQS